MNVVSDLPKIVRFLGTDDCPGAECPHCGATGRWIHRFTVADGRNLAAMSGCVKLFPVSQVAAEEARLQKKAKDYADLGWGNLNRNDQEALRAIEEFYAGTRDEQSTLRAVHLAKTANQTRFLNRRRS